MEWDEVTIIDLEAAVSSEIMLRGVEYHQNRHVLRACRFDCLIAGEVAGAGGAYRVRLTLDNGRIDGCCSCPYPGFCKHMVALGLAWIEKSVEFYNINDKLDIAINEPEQLADLLVRLIRKDPLNFLDLIDKAATGEEFVNSRGILNLIRNTFRAPQLTAVKIEAQWERIKRIEDLVSKAIVKGEREAPELLGALLKGVSDSEREYPSPQLEEVFRELLSLAQNFLKGCWTRDEVDAFIATLWDIYFDCSLWELAESVRPVLNYFYEISPEWFHERMAAVEWRYLGRPKLILFYELLTLTAKNSPPTAEYLKQVTEILKDTPEGQLWLIDRVLEDDTDRAFLMAKEGLRKSNSENKQAFRERLIAIHLRRGENKQAASLSYLQFQEGPNLEEYLRLKKILAGSPNEFLSYLKKMDRLVETEGLEELAAAIAFDRGDWVKLGDKIEEIKPEDPFLKELAKLLKNKTEIAPKEIVQRVISRLLAGGRSNWETALSLLVIYKKLCLNSSRHEEWKCFQANISAEYCRDRRFTRKFGAVLAG